MEYSSQLTRCSDDVIGIYIIHSDRIVSDKAENLMGYCSNPTNEIEKLHDICNWNELDNVIIEYHDLRGIIIYITYRELLAAKIMLSDHLNSIESCEFIGINFDIPEYCVVSLILG